MSASERQMAMSVIDDVRQFMQTELKVARADAVRPEDRLVDRGIVDSIELMQIAGFVETKYGIAVPDTDVVPENFGSLAALEAYVQRKRRG